MTDPAALDRADPLRRFRDQFELPRGVVYLAGHSLGPLPKRTVARVAQTVQNEWGRTLVAAWDEHDWIGAPARIGAKIATLIGADADEVLVADSTSVNLFKLIAALMIAAPERRTLLIESGEFPTDMHVAQGATAALGRGRQVRFARQGQLAERIDENVALVVASHVHYRDARIRDMLAITQRAREAGALVIWDLSHSAGAILVDLHGARADFAVGCGYKYLNGGPGAPAYLYISRQWQERLSNPISGWLGHADPFSFVDSYNPAAGLARFASGTPPILALAALEAGVELMAEAPRTEMTLKTQALQQLFLDRVFARRRAGLSLLGPEDVRERGVHVALRHKRAELLVAHLARLGVISDFRPPDAMRFAFAPLYTSFADSAAAADALVQVLQTVGGRDLSPTAKVP
jgi:kynureninase